MREQSIAIAGNADDFMAGIALFDELLREAERRAFSDDRNNSMNLCGENRYGEPLTLFALEFLETLIHRPELAKGFAGALGDCVGMLQAGLAPAAGDQYTELTFEDCVESVPGMPDDWPASNVVPLACAARKRGRG